MRDPGLEKLIVSDPGILSGTPVFVRTRVPVSNLFAELKAGRSIDAFTKEYPTAGAENAHHLLVIARKMLIAALPGMTEKINLQFVNDLFSTLAKGGNLETFLESHPTATREDAKMMLELAGNVVIAATPAKNG